jgi:diamine N-acetyltransferase
MISFGSTNLWMLEKQDLGDHYRWANNDNFRRLLGGYPRPRATHDVEAWFQTAINDSSRDVFSIKTPAAKQVGWAQFTLLNYISGSADVGIVIDEEEWGKGYGHDALVALVRYAFEDLRLHRLGADILAINLPSKSLFEKVGFSSEGVRKEAYYTSGRFLDVECYGLLSRNFSCPQPKSVPENDKETIS